jgi:hypothetical protein
MFGSVDEWFYKELAGIQPAPDAVGFDKIIIRPRILGGLKWAKANYQSVRGPVASAWKIRGGKLRLNVTIPANASAEIFVPVRADGSVDVLTTPKGERAAKPLRHENGYAVFAAGPGDWAFRTVWE